MADEKMAAEIDRMMALGLLEDQSNSEAVIFNPPPTEGGFVSVSSLIQKKKEEPKTQPIHRVQQFTPEDERAIREEFNLLSREEATGSWIRARTATYKERSLDGLELRLLRTHPVWSQEKSSSALAKQMNL